MEIPKHLSLGDSETQVVRTIMFLKDYGVSIEWKNLLPNSLPQGHLTSCLPEKPKQLDLYKNKSEQYNMNKINNMLTSVKVYEDYLESLKPNIWATKIHERLTSNIEPKQDHSKKRNITSETYNVGTPDKTNIGDSGIADFRKDNLTQDN